jgi:hypothetical protein
LKVLGLHAANDNPRANVIAAPAAKFILKKDIDASMNSSNLKRLANPDDEAMSLKWTPGNF